MVELTLRDPVNRVSPRARWYWAVLASIRWIVLGVVEAMVWAAGGMSGAAAALVFGLTGLLAVAHLSVMPQWRYRVHRWEATETAVYTQAGWFTQERRIAPVNRIQTVDTHRGPIEQLFRLANVTVTTASAAGPLKIHGLDRTVADRLVEVLTARSQAADGDGT